MKIRSISTVIMFLSLVFVYTSCSNKSEYQKLVDSELATNVRQDSLFLGISLQMESKAFFGHCWELNKQGVLTNGVANQVKYDVSDNFNHDASMYFYPKFVEGKIFEMPMEFQYDNWALWNEELSVDNLMEEVKGLLEDWYGEGFIKVVNEDASKSVWVKVDGNRRIRVYRKSVSAVAVVFTDLIQLKTMNEEES